MTSTLMDCALDGALSVLAMRPDFSGASLIVMDLAVSRLTGAKMTSAFYVGGRDVAAL